MSRFVRMFQPRFATLVESGKKLQTVRAKPRRMPKVGDILDAREWTGRPYASKQRKLGDRAITKIEPIEIRYTKELGFFVQVGDCELGYYEAHAFARADGFSDFGDMITWLGNTHTHFPFCGIVIYWGA